MRLAIASAYYWPETAGNAPYVTAMAEFLAERGHDVEVITGVPHYPAWSADRRPSERRNGVHIRRRRHYVPARQSTLRRAAYEASLFAGASSTPPRRRTDLVLGISPALSGAIFAVGAARALGCRSAVLFQDLMGLGALESGVKGGKSVSGVVRRAESWSARRANRVAIVAEGFRPYLEAGGVERERIVRVRNWTLAPAAKAPIRDELGWKQREFVCLHAGNMGHKQGLENVLASAELLEDEGVRIVLLGDGNRRASLENEAHRRRSRNVTFLDPQPAGRYEQILASADALIVNQRGSVSAMSLPSKLTAYSAAGRPIVAALAVDSEAARELRAASAALVVPPDRPDQLAGAIRRLQGDAELRASLARAGRSYAERELDSSSALLQLERFVMDAASQGEVA